MPGDQVDHSYTPLPAQPLTPLQVALPAWFNLPANDRVTILDAKSLRGQLVDVEHVGARPETDVSIELEGRVRTGRGVQSDEQGFATEAIGEFNTPLDVGPLATERLRWRAINDSGTAYTQANTTAYQTYLNYVIRQPTLLEKLRRGVPLTQSETDLAQRQFGGQLSLDNREDLNIPPEDDPVYEPTLEGKTVLSRDAVATSVDINDTGAKNPVNITTQRVVKEGGAPQDVLYCTGLSINAQEFGSADDLTVALTRTDTDGFYRLDTFGIPGAGDGTGVGTAEAGVSHPPYEMDLFVPFTESFSLDVFAQNALAGVQVKAEFARVRRTLIEKAIHGLQDEIISNDQLAQDRRALYEQLRSKLRVGLPIDTERDQAADLPGRQAQPR